MASPTLGNPETLEELAEDLDRHLFGPELHLSNGKEHFRLTIEGGQVVAQRSQGKRGWRTVGVVAQEVLPQNPEESESDEAQ